MRFVRGCGNLSSRSKEATEIMGSVNGKPDKPLTQRQEEFCRAIVQGSNQSDAFRASHNTAKMMDTPGRARRFFLTRGQVSLIHPRMACASRSTARRCGFWGRQPRARRRRLR